MDRGIEAFADLLGLSFKIKRLRPEAIMPVRATEGSVGFDLFATEATTLPGNVHFGEYSPCKPQHVQTGWALEIPPGYEAQIRGRSSLAAKGILVHVGTIDSDYRGEVGVLMYNIGGENHRMIRGDRIAQLVFAPVALPSLVVADELSASARGAGGYGSTGR